MNGVDYFKGLKIVSIFKGLSGKSNKSQIFANASEMWENILNDTSLILKGSKEKNHICPMSLRKFPTPEQLVEFWYLVMYFV